MKKIATFSSDLWFNESMINTLAYLFTQGGIDVINLNHKMQRNNLIQAVYDFAAVIKYYETQIWHVNMLSIGDIVNNYIIVTQYEDFVLITPDNGFHSTLNRQQETKQFSINFADDNGVINQFSFIKKSIQIINHYHQYKEFESIADFAHKPIYINPLRPQIFVDGIVGKIIKITNDNNVIINITKEQFEEARNGRNFKYHFSHEEFISQISKNSNDVNMGEIYMVYNDAGYLEIGALGKSFSRIIHIYRNQISNFTDQEFSARLIKDVSITIYFK